MKGDFVSTLLAHTSSGLLIWTYGRPEVLQRTTGILALTYGCLGRIVLRRIGPNTILNTQHIIQSNSMIVDSGIVVKNQEIRQFGNDHIMIMYGVRMYFSALFFIPLLIVYSALRT